MHINVSNVIPFFLGHIWPVIIPGQVRLFSVCHCYTAAKITQRRSQNHPEVKGLTSLTKAKKICTRNLNIWHAFLRKFFRVKVYLEHSFIPHKFAQEPRTWICVKIRRKKFAQVSCITFFYNFLDRVSGLRSARAYSNTQCPSVTVTPISHFLTFKCL